MTILHIAAIFKERKPGFTLVEILIAAVILGISAYTFMALNLTSKLWLSKAYYKTKAIEIASTKMEENLAKSYSGLGSSQGLKCLGSDWEADMESESACQGKAGYPFQWTVLVTNLTKNGVPYKQADVSVSYTEAGTRRMVSLTNFIAYPYINIITDNFGSRVDIPVCPLAPPANFNPSASVNAPTTIYSTPFNFPVKKNFQISYNLAVSVDDPANIQPLNTIYTRCRLVLKGRNLLSYPETRTPILTQPLINNWTEIDDVPAGEGTLIIEWCKGETAGDISLQTGNAIILAVENL